MKLKKKNIWAPDRHPEPYMYIGILFYILFFIIKEFINSIPVIKLYIILKFGCNSEYNTIKKSD